MSRMLAHVLNCDIHCVRTVNITSDNCKFHSRNYRIFLSPDVHIYPTFSFFPPAEGYFMIYVNFAILKGSLFAVIYTKQRGL